MAYKSLPILKHLRQADIPLSNIMLHEEGWLIYLTKADDSEEEVDDDNISEEVVPSASKQKKKNENVNNINYMDSTEYIEKSNFEGLEYIINNLPEANKVQEYLQQLDFLIPMEDHLSDEVYNSVSIH
ncbi:hypothetical protein C1646_754374 [Rhizophagus diaphanus]|nr:hypothetical protein C1646_754374 [Rhizophagus diaphanus] [Rhizophagus sp. MUCL 43196]